MSSQSEPQSESSSVQSTINDKTINEEAEVKAQRSVGTWIGPTQSPLEDKLSTIVSLLRSNPDGTLLRAIRDSSPDSSSAMSVNPFFTVRRWP